jgi:uncharacterized membrane protein
MDDWSFLSRCLLAGGLGAWAASFLIHLYNAIRYPKMLGDGQYVMIFFLTVPLGWLLGSIVGTVVAYLTVPPPHPALWKIAALIIGGSLGSPFVAMFGGLLIGLTVALPVELLTRLFGKHDPEAK